MSMLNIQNNKYTPNPLPEIVAPRHELLIRFHQLAKKKLVYISAPAGSGKTVSSILWMKKSNRKPVWIGLDAYDNSISIFYRMFCAGILSVQPDNSRMIEIIQNPAFYSAPVEHTIMLLSEFRADEGDYVLALDDFHTITNQEILKSLPYILRRLPHSFVTFILSRNEPEKYISEYINTRQAAVIGKDDLSFSAEEIKGYFETCGHRIDAPRADAVFNLTEGWASFIGAIAATYNAKSTSREFGHLLYADMERLMWSQWDEDTQAFLIATAVIEEMPVPLCEKITGRADAGALLERLRIQHAFITRVEDGVYRYHSLFLDFLRSLPEYTKIDKKNVWCIIAEYYENTGDIVVASQYACKSGHIKTILDTLHKYMTISDTPVYETIYHLKSSLFKADFEKLCEECPVLYEPVVYMSFSTGDALRFEKYMDKLQQNLPVIINEYPKFTEAAVTFMLLDYLTPLGAHLARLNEFPPAVFQNPEIRRATYSFRLPFLHRGNRDFYELTDQETHDEWVKSSTKILKSQYEPIIHGTNAGLYLEQNRITEALSEAEAAVGKLTERTTKEIRFSAHMHLAAVYLALGNETEFAALRDKTEIFINEEAEFLRPNFLAFTVREKLWDGDTSAAKEWLDNYFVTEGTLTEPYRLYQHFTTVRAYAVLGELKKAKDLAKRLRQMGKDFRRPQDAAEAGVLLAVILWAENKKEEAQEIMETVLSEMRPYSFIRLIADEGAAVLQVLKRISGKTKHANYQGLLDFAYVNSVYFAAYAVSKQRGGIMAGIKTKPEKLSKRQAMMIRLLARGYDRESIAENAGLSLNTVKVHMNLAYKKLGVSNAADAVVKARVLGIIE